MSGRGTAADPTPGIPQSLDNYSTTAVINLRVRRRDARGGRQGNRTRFACRRGLSHRELSRNFAVRAYWLVNRRAGGTPACGHAKENAMRRTCAAVVVLVGSAVA